MNIIVKNVSWIVVSKIIQSFLGLAISMISARYLGPSNYGLIAYASSITAVVLPIMQLGLNKTLVMDLIENPDKEGQVLGTSLLMNIASSFACMILVYLYLRIADNNEPTTIIVGVIYSTTLLFQATENLQFWFQAKLLSKYISITSLFAYVVVSIYKIVLLVNGKSVIWFAASNSLDYIIISIVLLFTYKKLCKQKLSFSFSLGRKMIEKGKYYILSSMMVTVFQQTDRIMIKQMLGERETGYYSAAIACVNMSNFVFQAIIDSFRPIILEAKNINKTEYETRIEMLYFIVSYLSILQSLLITVFAKQLILITSGSEYFDSIVPLQIVVWYSVFSYFGAIRNIWILGENKQKYLWVINVSGAILNVTVNFLLIPTLGIVGAAISSLTTQFFTNYLVTFFIKPIRYNNSLILRGLDIRKQLPIFLDFCFEKKDRN